jgi:predicted lipoprotein with Yx(FWY)xxD motif
MNEKTTIAIIAVIIIIVGALYYYSGYNYGTPYPSVSESPNITATPSPTQIQQATNTPTAAPQLQTDVTVGDNPSLGKIFVDDNGMTLYTFKNDTAGASACSGNCAVIWPPLIENSSLKIGANLIASKFSVITRADGAKQIAFEGMPLYYYSKDAKPGDVNGQGIGNVWYVYQVASDDLLITPTPTQSVKPTSAPTVKPTPTPSAKSTPTVKPTATPVPYVPGY